MDKKLLNSLSLLLFAILLVAAGTTMIFSAKYKTSNQDMLHYSLLPESMVSFADLHHWLEHDMPGKIVFIDLREPKDFAASQLPGSVNIPAGSVLERKHHRLLKTSNIKIILAADEATALMTGMILKARGYNNIRVLEGNFAMLEKHVLKGFDPAFGFFSEEKAAWDYPRFMKMAGAGAEKSNQPVIIPQMKRETVAAQGGC